MLSEQGEKAQEWWQRACWKPWLFAMAKLRRCNKSGSVWYEVEWEGHGGGGTILKANCVRLDHVEI